MQNSGFVRDILYRYLGFQNFTYTLLFSAVLSIIFPLLVSLRIFYDYLTDSRSNEIQPKKSVVTKTYPAPQSNLLKISVQEISNNTTREPMGIIRNQYIVTSKRLSGLIADLNRKANVNLFIGITATLFALTIMFILVLEAKGINETVIIHGTNNQVNLSHDKETNSVQLLNLIQFYVPRLTLALFIEIFAFFFLRLYRNNLDEVKYFQNELTNIESKQTALEAGFLIKESSKETLEKVILNIVSTERNFILEKGQSTVDLERNKLENKINLASFETLSQFLNGPKNSKSSNNNAVSNIP